MPAGRGGPYLVSTLWGKVMYTMYATHRLQFKKPFKYLQDPWKSALCKRMSLKPELKYKKKPFKPALLPTYLGNEGSWIQVTVKLIFTNIPENIKSLELKNPYLTLYTYLDFFLSLVFVRRPLWPISCSESQGFIWAVRFNIGKKIRNKTSRREKNLFEPLDIASHRLQLLSEYFHAC